MTMQKRNDCKSFALAVKHRLLEIEMTQKELADITGVNLQYIYLITNGIRPGLKHREKIRAAIGMPSVRNSIGNDINPKESI